MTSLRGGSVGLGEQLLQLTAGVQLHHDVAAADELAADVQLRDGGPVAARGASGARDGRQAHATEASGRVLGLTRIS